MIYQKWYVYCEGQSLKSVLSLQQTHTNPITNHNTVDREITLPYGNYCSRCSHINMMCSSACWARMFGLKRPWMFPSHTHMLFHFSVQVWTGPAPFLVRPITTKAWPPLDLAPSPVSTNLWALFIQFELYQFKIINCIIPCCCIFIHYVFCVFLS